MKKTVILFALFSLILCSCGQPSEPVFSVAEPEAIPESEAAAKPLSPIDEKIASMSLEEKVWQLMYVYPEDVSGELCCTDREIWEQGLSDRPAGGIVFVSENFPSEADTRKMMEILSDSDRGLFLGLDEEGGQVARLSYALGVTTDFEPMYEYRSKGRSGAFLNAQTIGRDIASFGFNMDFAPVADVWTNWNNTVIGRRAYSRDPLEASILVSAAVSGYHSAGVISVLKHFPGHGDTNEDSHYFMARTRKSLEEMRSAEFLPFSSGISAGAEAVMVGHIVAESIDPDNPATLSKDVIGILRQELGFEGLVITDAFTMAGLGDIPEDEAAVKAILAGCDMILAPADPDAAVRAIMADVSEERIEESVKRILELKYGWGIME